MGDILHILEAKPLGGLILDVKFDNGVRKAVDVTPLLQGPVFEPLRDPEVFAGVFVDPVSRTVAWPTGADLAPEALLDLPAVNGSRPENT